MKKFLQFLIVLLVLVAVAVVVLMMVEPKDVTVARTIVIKAPKDVVFDQIVKFKNWNNWSPWYRMDSGKMVMTYYGMDGTPGSGYTWEGDKTGAGDMHDSTVNGTDMLYQLTFTKPHGGSAWGHLKAEDTAGMTKFTWTCNMHFGAPSNAMLVFMNMEKMLGPDFENGLKYMKEYVESHATASPTATDAAMNIAEVEYPAHIFEGIRKTVSTADMAGMKKLFDDSRDMMVKNAADKMNSSSVGIYFTWDTAKKETDMVAAFQMSAARPFAGAEVVNIPAGKAVMAILKGGYGKEMAIHEAIAKHMAASGQAHGPVIEEYIVGPHEEPDSNKWVTNIYYMLK